MRLFIALPVLIVVVAMAVEGPAPAQAAPDLSSTLESIPGKLKEFGSTLEDKARAAIDHIKQKEILTKTRSQQNGRLRNRHRSLRPAWATGKALHQNENNNNKNKTKKSRR
ncbi:apolipoprotein C-I isoform X1 [Arvicanthis niloticus]|uniref:apolipoprotein C-I isoform X1 n=1 Tax=Arvicanthis niloticus TaxID=61156 RepID=UPI00402B9B8B